MDTGPTHEGAHIETFQTYSAEKQYDRLQNSPFYDHDRALWKHDLSADPQCMRQEQLLGEIAEMYLEIEEMISEQKGNAVNERNCTGYRWLPQREKRSCVKTGRVFGRFPALFSGHLRARGRRNDGPGHPPSAGPGGRQRERPGSSPKSACTRVLATQLWQPTTERRASVSREWPGVPD